MSMSKRDFQCVANALNAVAIYVATAGKDSSAEGDAGGWDTLKRVCDALSSMFSINYPNFDIDKWQEATAGVTTPPVDGSW